MHRHIMIYNDYNVHPHPHVMYLRATDCRKGLLKQKEFPGIFDRTDTVTEAS